jgi:pilus assembly protein Flp/PilA
MEEKEMKSLKKMFGSVKGAALTEYALLVSLIALVVIAALLLLGPKIGEIFNTITNAL